MNVGGSFGQPSLFTDCGSGKIVYLFRPFSLVLVFAGALPSFWTPSHTMEFWERTYRDQVQAQSKLASPDISLSCRRWERDIVHDYVWERYQREERVNGSLRTGQVHPLHARAGSQNCWRNCESHGSLRPMESATDTASPRYQRTFDWSIVRLLSFSSRDGDGRHCYDVCGQRNT